MNNVINAELWAPNYEAELKKIGDSALRKTIHAAFVPFDERINARSELLNLHRTLEAWKKLQADGFEADEKKLRVNQDSEAYPALIRRAINERRHDAIEELQACVWAWATQKLADAVAPEVRRCLRKAAAEIREQIAVVISTEDKLAKVYGYDGPKTRSELIAGLEGQAKRFEKDAEAQFKLDWHWRPKIALGMYFHEAL
jgi:hypothetical protein